LRHDLPEVFTSGSYVPLESGGARADHVVAFMRQHRGRQVIVAAGRLFAKLSGGKPGAFSAAHWEDSWIALPDGARTEILSGRTIRGEGGRISVPELFRSLPVAVLAERR
jgi:(1->4)-alpha-D-glucan 1-alpha-D-glucosylmutase